MADSSAGGAAGAAGAASPAGRPARTSEPATTTGRQSEPPPAADTPREELPAELKRSIAHRLPIEALVSVRCASSCWRAAVDAVATPAEAKRTLRADVRAAGARGTVAGKWASSGNLDLLKWGKAQLEVGGSSSADGAGRGDPLEGLRAMRSSVWLLVTDALSAAAGGGHLEVLQWLISIGCPWDKRACSAAAEGGHVEVVRWLRAHGCPWSREACNAAAGAGHLEMLQWLRANGCPWNETTCKKAVRAGHLEVLKWMMDNDCPWDRWACQTAAWHGHLEVLQWLYENGCSSDAQLPQRR